MFTVDFPEARAAVIARAGVAAAEAKYDAEKAAFVSLRDATNVRVGELSEMSSFQAPGNESEAASYLAVAHAMGRYSAAKEDLKQAERLAEKAMQEALSAVYYMGRKTFWEESKTK